MVNTGATEDAARRAFAAAGAVLYSPDGALIAAREYVFVDEWDVDAPRDAVYDTLVDARTYPDWWKPVYISVEGDERVTLHHFKGRLPYTLKMRAELVSSDRPNHFEVAVDGDLRGKGVWTADRAGGQDPRPLGLDRLRRPRAAALPDPRPATALPSSTTTGRWREPVRISNRMRAAFLVRKELGWPCGRRSRTDRPRPHRSADRREARTLDERTPKSRAMYERARQALVGGVPSSYQLREPWPIYLERGEGSRVWDVDGNEMFDFHNGFGAMTQGHAHPAITRAVGPESERERSFAAPTRGRGGRRRGAPAALGAAANGGSPTAARVDHGRDPGRPRADRARHDRQDSGSYHGHHDAVMVGTGSVDLENADPDNLPSLLRTERASRRPSST